MPNYKIVVSKDNKRYTLALKAENEFAARERVHKEGYSILTLQEIGNEENIGATFIFEGYKDGELKHGKIAGNDIFKSYVKLRKDLGYNIDYIYSEKEEGVTIEQKQKIIEELREEFDLYYNKKGRVENIKKTINQSNKKNESLDLSGFYLNRELEETNRLVDNVLQKLESFFTGENSNLLTSQTKEKLKQIHNEIVKLKKSTNISKLKEIGELALQKIGEIELQAVEKDKSKKSRNLLKETNKLLREFGSKNQFVEKERNIGYQIKSLFSSVGEVFSSSKNEKSKERIDKESYSYIKNLLYLNKYKQKRSEKKKFIIKNFFKILFDKNLREDTFLALSVIQQNIALLEAKEKGVNVSYTFLKKGFGKLKENLIAFFQAFTSPLFIVIFIYTFIFILYFYVSLNFSLLEFSFDGLFAFIIVILLYLGIYFSKNMFFLILNFVILSFIIIFGVINF